MPARPATYFEGEDGDAAYDVKGNSAGNLYVTGFTMSSNLPVTANAAQPCDERRRQFTSPGKTDGFVINQRP